MGAERQRCPRDSDWCDGLVCEDVGKIGCPNRACGRVLVGQGADTWDPVCMLPVGHSEPCNPAEPDPGSDQPHDLEGPEDGQDAVQGHATRTDGVWRVMRFENAAGKWAEVASNHVGPEAVPLPAGYRFVSSTPMVPTEQVAETLRKIMDSDSAAHSRVLAAEALRTMRGGAK